MLRPNGFLLCLCTVSFLATFFVTTAWSAPDPTANKNAISIDLDCGGDHVGSGQNQFRSWTASLRHDGFLVQIQGPDRALVVRAAQELRPIPAGAR
jgi:hypothetical protein